MRPKEQHRQLASTDYRTYKYAARACQTYRRVPPRFRRHIAGMRNAVITYYAGSGVWP